jgi:hypothetical protein
MLGNGIDNRGTKFNVDTHVYSLDYYAASERYRYASYYSGKKIETEFVKTVGSSYDM